MEQTFGIALFQRVGRQLELTEAGRQALPYAEQMFQTGNELEAMLRAPNLTSSRSRSALGWRMWCPNPSCTG